MPDVVLANTDHLSDLLVLFCVISHRNVVILNHRYELLYLADDLRNVCVVLLGPVQEVADARVHLILLRLACVSIFIGQLIIILH